MYILSMYITVDRSAGRSSSISEEAPSADAKKAEDDKRSRCLDLQIRLGGLLEARQDLLGGSLYW